MKKFFLTLILAAFCGMSSAFAYDFSAVCPTGQTLYYNIIDAVNHEVELTHPNVSIGMPWYGFPEPSGEIELPSSVVYEEVSYTVTSIGCSAFGVCRQLSGNLVIPNSVTSIEKLAFWACSGFTGNLVLSNSVTTIGESAFTGCYGFTGSLILPNSVSSIENKAFDGCKGFSGDLVLPNSLIYIGKEVFKDCTGFTGNLVISESISSIGDNAFKNCQGFTSLTLKAANCTTMGSDSKPALSDCTNLTSIHIESTVTRIPDYAFYDCQHITNRLIIPNSVARIGKYAFYNCIGFTGKLKISNSLTQIDEYAFYNCQGFTGELIFPNSATKIGNYAFYNCKGFTGELIIPNALTNIGISAFQNCTGFTGDLIIPNSVIWVDENAFSGCSGFSGNLVIGDDVFAIGGKAFDRCYGFSSVTFNAKHCSIMGSITSPAFGNNSYFTSLTIGKDVQSIPNYAFYGCEMILVSNITANGVVPPTIGEVALGDIRTYIPIHVPCGAKSAYQTDDYWKMFTNYQTDQVFPYQITITSENEAFGSVTIIQQPDCETDAIVEATANEGCSFKGWSVNGEIISTENPFTFAVTEDTELVAIFSGLGVDDNEMTTASVYPNPTTGLFIIEGQDITEVEVYNAQGQLIRTQMISGDRTEIDLSNAANGLYLVRIMSGAGVTERTVVKR